jgi:tricarballylate dehydrogenase
MRTAYDGVADVRRLVPSLSDEEMKTADFGAYSPEAFYDDLGRLSGYQIDPDLAEVLSDDSLGTLIWLSAQGVRFLPMYRTQAVSVGGRFKFFGGLVVEIVGGGAALVDRLIQRARDLGARFLFGTRAEEILMHSGAVRGVRVRDPDGRAVVISAASVIVATGGYESNVEWRARYLGPGWDLAKSRGSRFATGEGIRMAMQIGAASFGNWSGCHAVAWDRNAPNVNDPLSPGLYSRHSYTLGIMVNSTGRRFVDEGADFRNNTYGKYGASILAQPGHTAWQVFDGKMLALLREEYRSRDVTRYTAPDLPGLAHKIPGMPIDAFLHATSEFNAAVRTDKMFDPSIKDGRCTTGLTVPKSNWANVLDTPPFEAYEVGAAVTYTYGGVHISTAAEVLAISGDAIPGLFAAGGAVGGVFYGNSASGMSLTAGSVLGRIAGRGAADVALRSCQLSEENVPHDRI